MSKKLWTACLQTSIPTDAWFLLFWISCSAFPIFPWEKTSPCASQNCLETRRSFSQCHRHNAASALPHKSSCKGPSWSSYPSEECPYFISLGDVNWSQGSARTCKSKESNGGCSWCSNHFNGSNNKLFKVQTCSCIILQGSIVQRIGGTCA